MVLMRNFKKRREHVVWVNAWLPLSMTSTPDMKDHQPRFENDPGLLTCQLE